MLLKHFPVWGSNVGQINSGLIGLISNKQESYNLQQVTLILKLDSKVQTINIMYKKIYNVKHKLSSVKYPNF